ncbi:DUF45 domain-containing protein [Sphingosinicella sp. LHD-64]|uniref:M48 family metallopeptidase n=1 Tax=Sphingosinicella sp. LHD-64 TaxID=3072139 RepID=UPI00280D9002|nr:YgjP-like metallopeptidase domain-containing protein [Sphingosinicella sp. LHD-64]MDQ8757011.1 DUF45 domain-containing protein [Sphingosinicella sp. LHD-64]
MSSERALGDLPLTIRVSPTARRLRLKVDTRTRTVLLTIPRRVSRRSALAWAAGHRDWAERALAAIPVAAPIGPGTVVPLADEDLVLDWDPSRSRRIEARDGRLVAGGPLDGLQARVLRWLKARALAVLEAETREFGTKAGVMASKVGVGDPVSRWGSCASSGTIRYSWRLILAPAFVRRATVAHEVAHLVHMNHGPAFHALVAELLGSDPRSARLWLRREGARLHRFGAR